MRMWVGAALVGAMAFDTGAANAATFVFDFDGTFDTTLSLPFVGSGLFSFDGPVVNGTYALTSFTNYNFSYQIGSAALSTADITTPVQNVLVRFSSSGSDTLVNFGGARGGTFGGSLDFQNASGSLTLEPNFGSRFMSGSVGNPTVLGTFAGTAAAAPEPASWAMMIAGFGIAGGALRRSRRLRATSVKASVA